MNINITLVIQVCNFIIAYVIFDRVLLRRAVAVLDAQNGEKILITERIEQVTERIQEQEDENAQRWQACKEGFAIPDVQKLVRPVYITFPPFIPYKNPEPIIQYALTKEFKALVVERMSHGR